MINMVFNNKKSITVLFLCVAVIYFIIWSFTGRSIFERNQYNSFSLQADAWLNGRTDIVEANTSLELAIFNGRYYVSFPPLPSVIMLPFVIVFGVNTPDHIINLAFVMTACIYAYKTARNFHLRDESAYITALFYVLGSNMLFLMFRGWVWFFAQTISFAFCTVSIYFATTRKPRDSWLAFLFLSLAIGCRPFQAIYFFVTVYLVFLRHKSYYPSCKTPELLRIFLPKLIFWGVPAALVFGLYLGYNYMRFGNIFEFGHNYLPEFVESTHGQFSLSYIRNNLYNLIYIPRAVRTGLEYPAFNGFSIFMVYPMITLTLPLAIYRLGHKSGIGHYKGFIVLCLVSTTSHILVLCAHKTLGGWHFGNRYIADCLPYIFLLYISLADYDSALYNRLCLPFFLFGLTLNTVGTINAFFK